MAVIGTIPLRDLTVQDVRAALKKAGARATGQLVAWVVPGCSTYADTGI
jgi:hypothetical protein